VNYHHLVNLSSKASFLTLKKIVKNPETSFITKPRLREKTVEERKVVDIVSSCRDWKNFKDKKYKEGLQSIAEDGTKIQGAITTFEEHLNADNFDPKITLEEIKVDNESATKRNIDNFLNPGVINKFKNENFLNSLYLTHMKNNSLWKPDKFKVADKLINNIKQNK